VQFLTLHLSGTQFPPENVGSLFRPENALAPFSGGLSDVGPLKKSRWVAVLKLRSAKTGQCAVKPRHADVPLTHVYSSPIPPHFLYFVAPGSDNLLLLRARELQGLGLGV
jgi:hypothetical protein